MSSKEEFAKTMKKYLFRSKTNSKDDKVMEDDSLWTPVGAFQSNLTILAGRHFAVTCNYGPHENVLEGTTMKIYNTEGIEFETTVVMRADWSDYMVLESSKELAKNAPYCATNVIKGAKYLVLGYHEESKESVSSWAEVIESQNESYNPLVTLGTEPRLIGGGPAYIKSYNEFNGLCIKDNNDEHYRIIPAGEIETQLDGSEHDKRDEMTQNGGREVPMPK